MNDERVDIISKLILDNLRNINCDQCATESKEVDTCFMCHEYEFYDVSKSFADKLAIKILDSLKDYNDDKMSYLNKEIAELEKDIEGFII